MLLKFQAPKIKSQINPNDPNSKFQTNERQHICPKVLLVAEHNLPSNTRELRWMFWSLIIVI